jgi:hypothetical protein
MIELVDYNELLLGEGKEKKAKNTRRSRAKKPAAAKTAAKVEAADNAEEAATA